MGKDRHPPARAPRHALQMELHLRRRQPQARGRRRGGPDLRRYRGHEHAPHRDRQHRGARCPRHPRARRRRPAWRKGPEDSRQYHTPAPAALDQNRFRLSQSEKEFWSRDVGLSKILGSDWFNLIRFCSMVQNSTRLKTSGSICAQTNSRSPSSTAMKRSSTNAAMPGTSSPSAPTQSHRSHQDNGQCIGRLVL